MQVPLPGKHKEETLPIQSRINKQLKMAVNAERRKSNAKVTTKEVIEWGLLSWLYTVNPKAADKLKK